MVCKKCNGDMQAHMVSETKRKGCIPILFYLVLLIIPIIGWIALFKLLGGKGKTKGVAYAICGNCGYKTKL